MKILTFVFFMNFLANNGNFKEILTQYFVLFISDLCKSVLTKADCRVGREHQNSRSKDQVKD